MTTSELFPGPPPFFRQYDPSLQHEGQQQPPAPPAPPAQTTYQIFRQQYELREQSRSLTDFGVPQLYGDDENRIEALKRFNHALLFNFNELVQLLVVDPSKYQEKVNEIQVIFSNMHHIINEFRPVEAKKNLEAILKIQLAQRNELINRLTETYEKSNAVLSSCQDLLSSAESSPMRPLLDEAVRSAANSASSDASSAAAPPSDLDIAEALLHGSF